MMKIKHALQNSEINRFILVGLMTVSVDLIVYSLLLAIDYPFWLSKAISFVAGTIFSFFANRIITFRNKNNYKKNEFIYFILLYFSTMFVNIFINDIILHLMEYNIEAGLIGFFIATITSAALNYIGMSKIFNK